jgi:hypothetical protein
MKKFNFCAYGVEEMNVADMKTVDGGLIGMLINYFFNDLSKGSC